MCKNALAETEKPARWSGRENPPKISEKGGKKAVPASSQLNFNIERKAVIELVPTREVTSDWTVSPRKGGDNTYKDYFDNLIALIDEAARELSI